MLHALFMAFGATLGIILAVVAIPALIIIGAFIIRIAWFAILIGVPILLIYLNHH